MQSFSQNKVSAHRAQGKMDWDKQLAVSTTVAERKFDLTNNAYDLVIDKLSGIKHGVLKIISW